MRKFLRPIATAIYLFQSLQITQKSWEVSYMIEYFSEVVNDRRPWCPLVYRGHAKSPVLIPTSDSIWLWGRLPAALKSWAPHKTPTSLSAARVLHQSWILDTAFNCHTQLPSAYHWSNPRGSLNNTPPTCTITTWRVCLLSPTSKSIMNFLHPELIALVKAT